MEFNRKKGDTIQVSKNFGKEFLPKIQLKKSIKKNSNKTTQNTSKKGNNKKDKMEKNNIEKMEKKKIEKMEKKNKKLKIVKKLATSKAKLRLKRTLNEIEFKKTYNWIQWYRNSCRYDSFLTLFILGLFNKCDNYEELNTNDPEEFK